MVMLYGWAIGILMMALIGIFIFYHRKKKFNQLPHNNPQAFLKKGLRQPGKKVVACIGGDVVHGNISYNFVEDAAKRKGCSDYQFINDGVNGSTAHDVLNRLDSVIQCNPDYAIILVGFNDASAKIAPELAKINVKIRMLTERPTLSAYEKKLAEIVNRLKSETTAQIALLSLPVEIGRASCWVRV